MAPWSFIFNVVRSMEDIFVQRLLRSPTFHHGVRSIHRRVQDVRHGRDPNEPLRRGEATQHPDQGGGFFKYFVEELKMQAQGKETKRKGPK